MKLAGILEGITFESVSFNEDAEIKDIIFDSRKTEPDTLFVCIKGFKNDSHDLAKEIYDKGVRYFASERDLDLPEDATIFKCNSTRRFLALASANYFGRPAEKITTIGITGTKGKTSVSFMIKSIFESAGRKVGVIGSTGTYIGDKFYDTVNSTPESYLIHKYYRDMLDNGCDTAVIEATSQGFKLDRTFGINFDVSVFTNLSPDHIGEFEHKDFEEYLECKKRIFSQSKISIVNKDCDDFARITEKSPCPIKTFGISEKCDFSFKNEKFTTEKKGLKTSFDVFENGVCNNINLNTPGHFSIHNAVAAIAVARECGIAYNDIKQGLLSAFVKGRMEIVPTDTDYTVIIDFAHNEFSVKTLFDTMKLYSPKRIISVFGCGGNRSKLRRYGMGEVIGANSDLSIITSDNSRFEKVEDIIADILIGMNKTNGKYKIIPKRREAIKEALREAEEGDVILLIGKGHEMYEEIEGVQYPFDERQVVNESLCELKQQGDL